MRVGAATTSVAGRRCALILATSATAVFAAYVLTLLGMRPEVAIGGAVLAGLDVACRGWCRIGRAVPDA